MDKPEIVTDIYNPENLFREDIPVFYAESRPGAYHCCRHAEGFPFKAISPQFCDMLGYSRHEIEDLFDNRLANMVIPEDRAKLNSVYEMTAENNSRSIHFRMMTRQRDVIWVKGNVRLSLFGGERFYQATVVEITAEMKTQQALRQKNHEMELILSAIPGGLKGISGDGDLAFRFISDEAAALFGYTPDEMMSISGGTALGMVFPEDRERVSLQLQQCLDGTDPEYSVRYHVKCRDGSMKYIIDCGRRAEDENGVTYLQSLYIDITREKENEDKIQQLQLIRALSNDYSDVFLLDLQTEGLSPVFQQEGSAMLHLPCSGFGEWLARLGEDFVHPDDREEFLRRISISGITEKLRDREMFLYNYNSSHSGIISHWQVKCVGIRENGILTRAIVGFRNIDEEVQIEEERNKALHDALNQARYANRAKTSFLSNMSHDIRTPMNAIIGYTALASAHINDTERVSDYLRKITQSSNHLLSLINDVLDMSRIEAGKMNLAEKPESLPEILSEIQNIIQADVNEKKLSFSISAPDADGEVLYCDKLRINQILINLLSNAVKFTPPGGAVSLQVCRREALQEGFAVYEFRIKDTGIGIEKNFLKHIFEPFAQERPSTLSGIQGTGLGMAITKNLVDMYGGTIEVFSQPGKGTEIVVNLRLRTKADHNVLTLAAETAASSGLGADPELAGKRVLVVEDNEINQEISVDILSTAGITAEIAENGQKALDMLCERGAGYYSLVFMDIQMPGIDGYEAARRIRSLDDPVLASIPIAAMTANAYEDDRRLAFAAGMNCHIGKPIDIQKLFETLKKLSV